MLSSDDELQQRKSVFELMNQLGDIFDSIAPPTPNPDGTHPPKTAPMNLLPSLIESFETRKGIEILNSAEKDQLRAFSMSNPLQTITVQDLVMVLQAMGAASTPVKPTKIQHSSPSLLLETEPQVPPSPELVRTRTDSATKRHPAARHSISSSASTPDPITPNKPTFTSKIPVRPRTTSSLSNHSTGPAVTPSRGRSSMDGRRSSLEFRQRSSPLEPVSAPGHRPRSSLGGSFDQLRSRPVAPARMRRGGSQGPLMRSTGSTGSVEGRGTPSPSNARSPTVGDHHPPAFQSRTTTPTQSPAPLSTSPAFSEPSVAVPNNGGRRPSIDPGPVSTPTSITTFGSPPSSVDSTSYHPAPISPIGDIMASSSPLESPTRLPALATNPLDYFDSPDRAAWLRRERSRGSLASTDSQLTNVFAGEGGLGDEDSFRPESWGHDRAGSAASSSSADQFRALLRQAQELSRKLKESEARFATSASTYEQEHSDLEAKLDEARAELQDKRRQEKDLRSNEKQHLAQIASLEFDIEKTTKSLERSRESYDAMKRQYQSQLTEADNLRALVAETRRDNRQAEDLVQTHAAQVQQLEEDNGLLQQAVTKLEADLLEAKSLQDELDAQKQDNLSLKETIDRLRFDLDEIHSTSKKASILAGGGADSPADKLTASKSLGRELAQKLAEGNGADEESGASQDEESGEEDEDIVVTTTRRVVSICFGIRDCLFDVYGRLMILFHVFSVKRAVLFASRLSQS